MEMGQYGSDYFRPDTNMTRPDPFDGPSACPRFRSNPSSAREGEEGEVSAFIFRDLFVSLFVKVWVLFRLTLCGSQQPDICTYCADDHLTVLLLSCVLFSFLLLLDSVFVLVIGVVNFVLFLSIHWLFAFAHQVLF